MPFTKYATLLLTSLALIEGSAANIRFTRRSSVARAAALTSIPIAPFSVPLASKQPKSNARKSLLHNLRRTKFGGDAAPLAGSDFDEEYLVNVTVGGQHFAMIVDTGSSDTWLAAKGFTCTDDSGTVQPESTCAFGTEGFDVSKSRTFKPLPNTNFNITYADGEFLTGPVGFDTVAIGGMTVIQQEIGTVTKAFWEGDGINSGLMGLAYPNLTSVYEGTDPDADQFPETQLVYDPLFFTAVKEGAVSQPVFSIALDRGTFDQQLNDPFDPNLGVIAFGGMANVPVTKTQTTVPVQGYDADFNPTNSKKSTLFFYTVDVQSLSFPGSRGLTTFSNDTILDTGTTLNYVASDVAAAFNAAFKPPAVVSDEFFDLYVTLCSATAPTMQVTLGGATFTIDPADQLLPLGVTDENGRQLCFTGTQDGGPAVEGNIFILGDVFLHNVVVSFNIQTNQVTLTQRQPY